MISKLGLPAFLDAGRFASQVAKVVEFRTTHFAAANDIDVIDNCSVKRKDALDANAKAYLSHRHGLAYAAVFDGDANALKCLQPFLVAFLNPHVHTQRVARLKLRGVLFYLCLFDNV